MEMKKNVWTQLTAFFLAAAMCITLLAGYGSASAAAAETAETDYTTGTPWIFSGLDGVVTEDTETSLKDDFALYVNKNDLLSTEFEEGMSFAGTYPDVYIQAIEDIISMLSGDAPTEHDEKLAYDLYHLMMDWDSRNALGAAPLKERTDQVEAIDSIGALTAYMTETPVAEQLTRLWNISSWFGFDTSGRYVITVDAFTPLLSDSAEYVELTDYGAMQKDAYSELAAKMLVKLGYSEGEAAQKINNSFAFETLLAPGILTSSEQGGADSASLMNNPRTRAELLAEEGALPIVEVAEQMLGYPETDDYLVRMPAYLETLNALYTEDNLPLIKDYMIVRGVIDSAAYLDRECYEWYQACQNAISGAEGMRSDARQFAEWTMLRLAWPVGRLYASTYLRQEDKDRISALIDEILNAYHGIIEEADFLSDETKAAAIEKLEALDAYVLYPDNWGNYACDEVDIVSLEDGGTLWEAMNAVREYEILYYVKRYSEPSDDETWLAVPETPDCYYIPEKNAFYICGAFARGNIYNAEMSDEEVYAKLGAVIGHEISHAFDSTGAQFDKNGNLAMWWTEEDYQAFRERNEKLSAYFDAIHPWEGLDYDGSIKTGEAGADMGGLKCMLRIAAEKEDFDYDVFFRAFANLWMFKYTLGYAYTIINDVHPLGYLRINTTLQQFDEFLDFYGITEGDGMYLAPEDRVNIW